MTLHHYLQLAAATLLACSLLACTRPAGPGADQRVWTTAELKGLQGKTRDDIEEILGKPTGLYTFDSKDRWHYPNVPIRDEGSSAATRQSVVIYFSKFGEHRATIIDVMDRWEKGRE